VKLSEVMRAPVQDELEEPLPFPGSELAEPAITIAEAGAVDLSRDTTVCRWHRGQHTHLNTDGTESRDIEGGDSCSEIVDSERAGWAASYCLGLCCTDATGSAHQQANAS